MTGQNSFHGIQQSVSNPLQVEHNRRGQFAKDWDGDIAGRFPFGGVADPRWTAITNGWAGGATDRNVAAVQAAPFVLDRFRERSVICCICLEQPASKDRSLCRRGWDKTARRIRAKFGTSSARGGKTVRYQRSAPDLQAEYQGRAF